MSINKVTFVDPEFKREPYEFPISTDNPEEDDDFPCKEIADKYEPIREQIRSVASKALFHWTDVPVEFPSSLVGSDQCKLDLCKNLFIVPTFDETEKLARGPNGGYKKLNAEQLDSIRKTGQFDVPSVNFPGKFYRWELNNFLQKGYERSTQTMHNQLSFALGLIIVMAKNRFASDTFSVLSGLKSWSRNLWKLLDILIGLPAKRIEWSKIDKTVETKYQEYLLAELSVDDSDKQVFKELCNKIFINLKAGKRFDDSEDIFYMKKPAFYRTRDGSLIDLRLMDSKVVEKIKPILASILANDADRMDQLKQLRQTLIKQYRDEGMKNEQIIRLVEEKLLEQYTNTLLDNIRGSAELEKAFPGIGSTLCDQATALLVMREEKKKLAESVDAQCEAYKSELQRDYKIKSGVKEWLNQCVADRRREIMKDYNFTAYERTIERLRSLKLKQAAYFMERERKFMKEEHDKIVQNELKQPKQPMRTFEFNRWIWFPKNYIISKNERGSYSLIRHVTYKNSTSYPFWRWTNYLLRTWCYSFNSMYFFGLVIPFVSGVDLLFLTYFSRLSAIWTYVKKARASFEATPDRGLIGKSTTRIWNRFWNYIVVGCVGTVGLTAIYPPLCVTLSTLSIGLGLTSLVWYPVLSLAQHLLYPLVYDWEIGMAYRNYYCLFPLIQICMRLVVQGMASPVLALTSGLVVFPVTSALVTITALLRKAMRTLQDGFFYNGLIKVKGRVPAMNTWDIRRISGPGLASNHLYQMRPEQALAIVEMEVEKKILGSYIEYIRQRIEEPIYLYKKIFTPMFESFGYTTVSESSRAKPYTTLYSEVSEYYQKYSEVYHSRIRSLNRNRIPKARLTDENLRIVLSKTTQIVKHYYENFIFKYEKVTREEFFANNMPILNNDDTDWVTFAGKFLEDIFGAGILSPLEDSHEFFNLKVDHLDLGKYTKMIADSQLRDDLDVVLATYAPEKKNISVDIPQKSYESVFYPANRVGYRNNKSLDDSFMPKDLSVIAVIAHNANVSEEQKIHYK